MYVRMTRAEGITDPDKTAAMLGDNVVPALREQKGYLGLNASIDRQTGVLGVISTWESAADMEASAATADTQRQDFIAAMGGRITDVRTYELAVLDMAGPPGAGAVVVIVTASMDPASVDANLEFFKTNVLPGTQQAPGYRALRNMVDRQTGEAVVGIVFSDRGAAEAWIIQDAQTRDMAKDLGIELGEPQIREVIFTSA